MKRILYILTVFLTLGFAGFAQDDDDPGGKMREKMIEYIQKKLDLSKPEAERFSPVFIEYFKELRSTNNQFKGDRLVLQQKIVELRIRYRDQFKPIIGEKRSNDVFVHEREFVQKVQEQLIDRQNRKGGRANNKSMIPGL